MSTTTLTIKRDLTVPLEAEVLSPDVIASLSHAELCALPVFLGKHQYRLDEFFEVDGPGSENLEIRGNASRVKWIGRGMTRGQITVTGNAGMHLGAFMKAGRITVSGDASDWVGAEMTGGLIHIHGTAGGQLGAAYRGSPWGMNGGTILVEGAAGIEIGMRMKRGLIAVRGPVRDFAGLQMKGGTIVLCGGAEIRTGAWMVRGTIISLKPIRLLPTFAFDCEYRPAFVRVYMRRLEAVGFALPGEASEGMYRRYSGDAAVPGRGEVLICEATENDTSSRPLVF
jgi:formylmethanofuran dehydrogenase subunit C